MIILPLIAVLSMAAPQANLLLQPRKNYSACLHKFQKSSLKEKIEPAAFAVAVKAACPAEAAALTKALIEYDVAMGTKRAEAQSNALMDVEGYTVNLQESYKDHFGTGTGPE